MEQHYFIDLPYAYFGLSTKDGIVNDVAPIGSWMRGKHVRIVEIWVRSKGGKMAQVLPAESNP